MLRETTEEYRNARYCRVNAASRAQREMNKNVGEDGKNKKGSKPVDGNTFMDLMKRGTAAPEDEDEDDETE